MEREKLVAKLSCRTGVAKDAFRDCGMPRLRDYFRQSVSGAVTKVLREAGLYMIAAGAFVAVQALSVPAALGTACGAWLLAGHIESRRETNRALGAKIRAAHAPGRTP